MEKMNECYSYSQIVIKEIVKKDDDHTKQVIKDYYRRKYPNENVRIDFLDEEIVDEIIKLGINEYQKKARLQKIFKRK